MDAAEGQGRGLSKSPSTLCTEGSMNNQTSVCLLCLRQHTGGCASGPVCGPRTELPGAFPLKDRCPHCHYSMCLWTPLMLCRRHTPKTSVTWASPSVGISHSGHTAHSTCDSYSVCIARTTPTSYICISHIEDVSPTLCMPLTPCPPHTCYTSYSMCIPHTPCIPHTHVYLTHCAPTLRTLLCPTYSYSRPGTLDTSRT